VNVLAIAAQALKARAEKIITIVGANPHASETMRELALVRNMYRREAAEVLTDPEFQAELHALCGLKYSAEGFSAEVADGYLLIAIKIPTDTCAACGTTYVPTVDLEGAHKRYRAALHIGEAIRSPIFDGWTTISNGKPWPDNKYALICKTCAGPVAQAKADSDTRAAAAASEVTARIDWSTVK